MEKYYLVEKVKECFMIDAFNTNVVKQTGESLKMLSSKVIKPREIGIKLHKGIVSCTDDKYKMEEITEEQAIETLRKMDVNYSLWKDYMSTSDNIGSSHLVGLGGDQLI